MKLHPLSVPYRAGARLARFGWAIAVALFGAVSGGVSRYRWYALAALGVFVVVTVAYQVLEHERFSYELTGDSLDIDSGVLSRRGREIPLARVQNVDVTQNVVQRVLGIATVNVETAGGGETEAVLECVGAAEADRLQTEIRRRKRSLDGDAGTDVGSGEPAAGDSTAGRTASDGELEIGTAAAAGARGDVVFELDGDHLFLLSALSFDARLVSVVFGAQPFVWPVIAPVLRRYVADLSLGVLLVVAAAVTALGVLVLWAVSAARTFARYYGFRLTRAGGDLRYERGLFQRYSGTIPLEKLQTLVVTENVLMRRYGFASLRAETAGYAPGSQSSGAAGGGSATVVPLATRDAAFALARRFEPFDPPDFERPPKRARRRYVGRYAIAVAALLAATTLLDHFVVAYPLWWTPALLLLAVPPAAHYKYVTLGYALGDDHAFARRGFFARTTHVVPYHRVQTVVHNATVFQRRWRLADVVVDTAGSGGSRSGDAVMADVDTDRATELAETVTDRLRRSLRDRARNRRNDH